MDQRHRTIITWWSIFVGCIAFLCEFVNFWFNMILSASTINFLFFHSMIVAVLILFLLYSRTKKNDLSYPWLILISIVAAGPFGLAGFLLLVVLRAIFSRLATPSEQWIEDLFPEHELKAFERIFYRLKSGWDDYSHLHEVASFRDLFNRGTSEQKQNILDAIAKDLNPQYSAIIRLALNDTDNNVRIQAGAIVSKIDYDFDMDLRKLMNNFEKKPDDRDVVRELAEHYEAYASIGLLDQSRTREVAEMAISYFNEVLSWNRNDRALWFSIGQLLYKSGKYKDFITWYEDYIIQFSHVPEIIFAWYLESLYKEQRYEDLAAAAKKQY